jgi:hypothetical protein
LIEVDDLRSRRERRQGNERRIPTGKLNLRLLHLVAELAAEKGVVRYGEPVVVLEALENVLERRSSKSSPPRWLSPLEA